MVNHFVSICRLALVIGFSSLYLDNRRATSDLHLHFSLSTVHTVFHVMLFTVRLMLYYLTFRDDVTLCVICRSGHVIPDFFFFHLKVFFLWTWGRHMSSALFDGNPTHVFFKALSQNCQKRLLVSSYLSVCLSAWHNSAPTRWIFMKIDIWLFFSKICRENSSFIKM